MRDSGNRDEGELSIDHRPLSVALPSGGTPQRSGIGGALFRLQIYTIILKLPNFMVKNLYIAISLFLRLAKTTNELVKAMQ
jgi:hypothetical protein